ncbi:extracellular solute-binding protein [Paenibacillus sp. LHD-117]|uniref:extracellular solute-binding protein n=1 Tax=Paenibacillus sp. LHD-117 TaxID=3071412 RepID=UPI0027DFB72E|nr:extracellular solute-binding protein [Paenibacillus sp. LHD-117]MDQ6418417.1 extracellular solute-binding protein [Paenibacillus sp. LHD-117]
MLSKGSRNLVALVLLCAFVFTSVSWTNIVQGEKGAENSDRDKLRVDSAQEDSYDRYLQQYQNANKPEEKIVVKGSAFTHAARMQPKIVSDVGDEQGSFVYTEDTGTIEWEVEIPKDGLYNMSLRFFTPEGKASAIERQLLIDGETPFAGAGSLLFPRTWVNENEKIEQDNRGNDIRPRQVEAARWQEAPFKDSDGYYEEPYSFYFTAGHHRISLVSLREPAIIDTIEISQINQPPTYEELLREYREKGYKEVGGEMIKVQGEAAVYKSSPTLYPITDRSSPTTEPQSITEVKINSIGGLNWRMPGESITWHFEVPQDGLYKIGLKSRQEYLRGVYSTRTLSIDGQIPFQEMKNVPFYYSSDWKMDALGDGNEPYLYYLSKGKHELKLEVSLGPLATSIRQVQSSILDINAMYRKILMITSAVPDPFRDYNLEGRLPDMVGVFKEQSEILYGVSDRLVELTGENSDQIAILDKVAYQLKDLADRPETVQKRMDSLKINVGSLGAWIQKVREQPLEIDYLVVASPEKKMPKANASFFTKAKFEMKSLYHSFFEDYNSIGNMNEEQRTVTVWIGTGRDQAQVMKALADESFTKETGINVDLKLVSGNVLLQATLAGQGPDVAMQIANDIPVNYGMRNAIVDLSQFSDIEDVTKRFRDSAIVPYRFNDAVYALPEQQVFEMLFYRKDILKQLDIEVPETWEDVYKIIPVLQKNHMQFTLPIAQTTGVSGMEPSKAFAMLLYQMGGEFYKDGGAASHLDSEIAMQAFDKWTDFYTNYKFPLQFDFPSRFRTGEIPMGIADYTLYNTLSVSAPEIRGLWDFAPIPGTKQEDGTISREVASGGTAVVMLKQAKDKDAAWEFMKWWTSKETQVRFGREMEGLMGAAARYPTANIEALKELPWPVKDYLNLEKQWEWVRGVPEVAGGYYTGRNLDNAFREVVNNGTNTRDALYDYVQEINREITTKRNEMNQN